MRCLFILLVCLGSAPCFSQESADPERLAIGYYGHFGFQPGVRLSTSLSLNTTTNTSARQWLISPQLAFFTNPGDDRNLLAGVELGLKKPNSDKNAYHVWAIGLGYLAQSKFRSFSVNLGSGQTSDNQYVHNGFLLPTLSYEYDWATHRQTSWYMKYSVGQRMFGQEESSFMLFIELGAKLKWKKKLKKTDQ